MTPLIRIKDTYIRLDRIVGLVPGVEVEAPPENQHIIKVYTDDGGVPFVIGYPTEQDRDDALLLVANSIGWHGPVKTNGHLEMKIRKYEAILKRVLEWCEQEKPSFEIDADAIRRALQ